MKRLVIAVDCDDVLISASEYVVKTYNRLYGTNVTLDQAHTSGNPDWLANRDEVFRRLDGIQKTDEYALLPPDGKAINNVKELSKDHELHLVGARSEAVLGVTQ